MAADNEDKPLTIHLSLTSSPSTPRSSLTISPTKTSAAELRRQASDITSVPLDKLKLIFRGRVIPSKDDGDVVTEYKLEDGCVVHVMGKPVVAADSSAGNGVAGGAAGVGASTGASASAGASVTLNNNQTSISGRAVTTTSSDTPLKAALNKLRSSNDGATYRTALTTADKLLGNIVSHPMEEKYRTIKKSNPAFSKRLGSLLGGSDLLLASGFTVETRESVEYYVLTPSANAWPTLVAAREEVARVLAESKASASTASGGFAPLPPVGGAAAPNAMPGGMPNLFPGGMPGAGGGMPGGMPDMNAMQSMLSDPNMLQNVMGMMNNPMVQNMMRNDPRFANNPMLQQSLQALQSNPEMINQFSQMMNDPNARERMASMMSGMGGAGAGAGAGAGNDAFSGGPEAMRRQMEQFQRMSQQFGGSSGGFNAGGGSASAGAGAGQRGTTAGGGANNNNNTNNNSGGNDSEMTEEEMIAEAIARSLRES